MAFYIWECISKGVQKNFIMYRAILLCLGLTTLSINSHASDSNYKEILTDKYLVIDPYFSPHSGVSIGLFTRTLVNDLTPEIVKRNVWGTIGWEIVKSFVDIPITIIPQIACGMYFRLQTLVSNPGDYMIKGFLPSPPPPNRHNYDVTLLVGLSCLEYIEVLHQAFVFDFLRQSYRNTPIAYSIVLYPLLCCFKFGNSILGIVDEPMTKVNYIKVINSKHEKTRKKIPANDIQTACIIDLCANFLIYASDFLLINPNQKIRYLPLWVTQFTPFGICYGIDNYVALEHQIFLFNIKLGKSPFYTNYYGGIGVKTNNLWRYKIYTLDIEIQISYQPKLLVTKQDVLQDKNYLGGLVGTYHKLNLTSAFALYGGIGYKTDGYLAGKIAKRGVMWQAGISFNYTSTLLDI